MSALDLRHVLKSDTGLAGFARKRDAIAAAKAAGWQVADVQLAANRFCKFWVIAQRIGVDTLRAVTVTGGTVEVEFRGYR